LTTVPRRRPSASIDRATGSRPALIVIAVLALAVLLAVTPGRRREPTQAARLLKMFRAAGSYGLTAADVANSPPDGGAPILRFNSRVHELRREGHNVVATGRRRDRCQVFRLLEATPTRQVPVSPPEFDSSLFEREADAPPPAQRDLRLRGRCVVSWVKLDDRFHGNRKIRRAWRRCRPA
jgi:hypothetical protein